MGVGKRHHLQTGRKALKEYEFSPFQGGCAINHKEMGNEIITAEFAYLGFSTVHVKSLCAEGLGEDHTVRLEHHNVL